MSDPTPGSPQQAGAEIVRRCCVTCRSAGVEEALYGIRLRCGNPQGQAFGYPVDKHDTCDHWRKRGAE